VVKGYHAEEREEGVFAGGVKRLLDNVLKTLTATSLMSLSAAGLMGIVSAIIIELGAHKILAGSMTLGTFFAFNIFLGLLVAPVFQIVAHRHANHRGHYRPRAYARNSERKAGR